MSTNWKMAIVMLAVLLLAASAWTTRFKYGEMHNGPQIIYVRTNRFTDETERLTMIGWKAMVPADPVQPVDHTDPRSIRRMRR